MDSKLYQRCYPIVKRFYGSNWATCKANGFEFHDLVQEAVLYAWKAIKKYPNLPEEEKQKLITKAICWRLNALKTFSFNEKIHLSLSINEEFNDEDKNEFMEIKDEEIIENFNRLNALNVLMELKKILNIKEYYIITRVIMYKLPYRKIALRYDISHANVARIYHEAMKKIKEHFNKEN